MSLAVDDPLAHEAPDGLPAEAAVRRRISLDLEREGLGVAGFSVLVQLRAAGGELELRALHARFGAAEASAAEVVGALEARGLVTRERLATDRRAVTVRATDLGGEVVDRLFPEHAERVARGVMRRPLPQHSSPCRAAPTGR